MNTCTYTHRQTYIEEKEHERKKTEIEREIERAMNRRKISHSIENILILILTGKPTRDVTSNWALIPNIRLIVTIKCRDEYQLEKEFQTLLFAIFRVSKLISSQCWGSPTPMQHVYLCLKIVVAGFIGRCLRHIQRGMHHSIGIFFPSGSPKP